MDTNRYLGKVLDNRYEIMSLVGSGGMSLVFMAYDRIKNRSVAVKILKDAIASDELAVKRFVNEATAVSMLKHPNIVSVYNVSTEGEIKYIVLEYVSGVSLKDHMEKSGMLSVELAESISRQVLSALAHAHSLGIIHRDIKPQNIMLYEDGTVKVTDFGIAKVPGSETISLYDKAIGTANYINPEQASGRKIDARSDIYSFGATLYEMVTGRVPFVADTPIATAYMQIHKKPDKPTDFNKKLPKGFEQIILKALKKSPENRFQTANEMLSCLERIVQNNDAMFDFEFDEEAENDPFKDDLSSVTPELFKTPDINRNSSLTEKKGSSSVIKVSKSPKKKKKKKDKPEVIVEEVVIRKKSKVSMLCVILGILSALLCVCLVLVMYVFENYIMKSLTTSDSVTITVGDYMYSTYSDELASKLAEEGYDVSIEWVSSSSYLSNTVIGQLPEPSEKRVVVPGQRKCQLVLTVSSGEKMITLENYVGLDHRQAMIEMNALGLNVSFERQTNPAVQEGKIINTYPCPGTVITADTRIVVYVSDGNGNPYVEVPDFKNKTALELELALIKYGFLAGEIYYSYSDTVAPGRVISQNIIPGTYAPSGITKIDFTVSLGPEPLPPTVPTTP